MRTLIQVLSLVIWFSGGCLGTGCIVPVSDANRLFGSASQAPKLKVKKSWGGFSAEASTDFSGTMDGAYRPETGEVTLKAAIASSATPVVGANAELIKSMETIRIADINASVEKQQEVTKQFQAAADTARALGEAGIGVVGEMVRTISGSTVDVSTPWGVGLSGTLGTPQPAPIAAPAGASMTTTAITAAPVPSPAPTIVVSPTAPAPDGVSTTTVTTERKTEPSSNPTGDILVKWKALTPEEREALRPVFVPPVTPNP